MKKILILLSNVQYAIISDSDSWLVTNTCFLGQEKCRRPPPPSLVHAREVEFIHKSGKIVVFCKKCDLDFDLDFPDKNVILIWNQYLGCDFDFDFKITFHCVILILIWNQLQSDLSHHWRTDERTTITTIWKKQPSIVFPSQAWRIARTSCMKSGVVSNSAGCLSVSAFNLN